MKMTKPFINKYGMLAYGLIAEGVKSVESVYIIEDKKEISMVNVEGQTIKKGFERAEEYIEFS